jgi:hypothetical protein
MFMKTIAHVILVTALALPTAVKAQQPSTRYAFHTVAQPGTIIGGRTFTRETIIGSAALNDSAEVAFVASEPSPLPIAVFAVFTSRRVVAREGDVVGGKYIALIPADAILAINNAGQVAYEAWYADTREMAVSGDPSGRGIFVDDHLASDAVFDAHGNAAPFIFTDDGRIVLQNPGPAPASVKGTLPARIRLKLPNNTGVSITPPPGDARRPAPRKQSVEHPALTPFPMNHHGQILIPVNFNSGGFFLLLGTPGAR